MDDKLDKIRKILAKAEHPSCPEHEAAALMEMATTLIAKYGIDEALLAEAAPESNYVVGDRTIPLDAPYAREKGQLLTNIAYALRCRTVQRQRNGKFSMHLFGFESDLNRVELLYTSLLVQASHGLARAKHNVPWHEDLRAYRRTWFLGFAGAIHHRLKEAERKAEAEAEPTTTGRSVALVLADRSRDVESAVATEYPDLRQGRRRKLTGSGLQAGQRAGLEADLGLNAGVGTTARRQVGR